jgi:FtsP/CotA-like multicopper oxidase with cupredoxin domain
LLLTADHVYRGVAGLFLLDDPTAAANLPSDYGVDDIPVILQDKRLDGDGSLDPGTPSFSAVGQLGDTMLVNGTYNPHVEVRDELVRLRVLNASNGRVYNLGFDDDRDFDLVGTDGGFLRRPHTTNRIQVSPGERVEIVARFSPGERTVLRSGSSRINGESMDAGRVDAVVDVDTTEIWEVTNRGGKPHNFHVHDVQFRVVDYAGEPPPPQLQGPKDTVFLSPGTTARLALRFSDHTDPTVPYMFHCHVLAHEDKGMMGQFVVVEPGDEPDVTAPDQTHEH